jgi:transposase
MRPPNPITQARKDELAAFRKTKWSGLEFQRFLCVWLRVEREQTPKQIAKTLGWHVNTVRFTQQEFVRYGVEALREKSRGGRFHAAMTVEEEAEFLDEFAKRAGEGSILVVSEIRLALESRLGRKVAESTVYRLLARHGWRKVVPRPFHPKRDPEAAEAFKKGATLSKSGLQQKKPRHTASR